MNDDNITRYELLALSLGLKGNRDNSNMKTEKVKQLNALNKQITDNQPDNQEDNAYAVLFAAYKKMIAEDTTQTFLIDEDHKNNILDSIENTLNFYKTKDSTGVSQLLNHLRNNDPTSFLIIPLGYPTEKAPHASGAIIYKKENNFLIMLVEKNNFYHGAQATYLTIDNAYMSELSYFLFESNKISIPLMFPYEQIKRFRNLSIDETFTPLDINMSKQYVGNCLVNQIEATLKIALSYCREDLLKVKSFHPKWNAFDEPTLEMRKKFLESLKTDNPQLNKILDDVFAHYTERKEMPLRKKIKKIRMQLEKTKKKKDIYSKVRYFILKRKYKYKKAKWVSAKMKHARKYKATYNATFTEQLTNLNYKKNSSFLYSRNYSNNER